MRISTNSGERVKKQRTWKQYRAIDLTMFGVILVICEFIIVMAARFWFPGQPYTVSLAGAIASIMYMRWGYWGGIHAALAGTGVMDYREILKFMKERKPYIQATLENTVDENAVSSRLYLQELYDSL